MIRAVTIDAPAQKVWSWLVQIGQDRGGMYSYDWAENLLGFHIHSANQIRDVWQIALHQETKCASWPVGGSA